MSRFAPVESLVVASTPPEPLDEKVQLRVSYFAQLDDELTIVEATQLSSVLIERRGWEGGKIGELLIPVALVLPLYHALGDVIIEQRRIERPAASEVDEDATSDDASEQRDMSDGQTFSVDEGSILGRGE